LDITLRLGETVKINPNEQEQVDLIGPTENTMVVETNRFILAINF